MGLPDSAVTIGDSLPKGDRGQTIGNGVRVVVTVMLGALLAAFLIPIAIDELVTVNTSLWSGGAQSLWDLLPVIIVLAIFLMVVGWAVSQVDL